MKELDKAVENLSQATNLMVDAMKQMAVALNIEPTSLGLEEGGIKSNLSSSALSILNQCRIDGKNVFLPEEKLDRKIYQEVAKALNGIGGNWNRKVNGFVFSIDPTDLLAEIAGGAKRNLKKEFQFFATPADLADYLVELAKPECFDIVLEPSAGQGAIIEAIGRVIDTTSISIDAIELMHENYDILHEKTANIHFQCYRADFLQAAQSGRYQYHYNRIIANPPFSKNQDIDHIEAMYKCCKDGGRIVSVASNHWRTSTNKKETEFKNWLESIGAEIIDVPKGKFKDSGTMIATCIIVINK